MSARSILVSRPIGLQKRCMSRDVLIDGAFSLARHAVILSSLYVKPIMILCIYYEVLRDGRQNSKSYPESITKRNFNFEALEENIMHPLRPILLKF